MVDREMSVDGVCKETRDIAAEREAGDRPVLGDVYLVGAGVRLIRRGGYGSRPRRVWEG